MKRNTHVIVPESRFVLETPSERLSTYRFGTRTAQHHFCSHCGVCCFYVPRSNPDAVGVTVHCVDQGTLGPVVVKRFDGLDWEQSFEATNIAALSKG